MTLPYNRPVLAIGSSLMLRGSERWPGGTFIGFEINAAVPRVERLHLWLQREMVQIVHGVGMIGHHFLDSPLIDAQ